MTPVSPVGGEADVALSRRRLWQQSKWNTEFVAVHPEDLRVVLARLEAAESARDEALAVVERVVAAVYWGRSDGWVWKRDLRAALTPPASTAPTEESQA